MHKQSHRNLVVNFISRGDEGRYLHVQSGPLVANGTDGAAEQEKEGAFPNYDLVDKSKKSKKQADEKPPGFAFVDRSKIKESKKHPRFLLTQRRAQVGFYSNSNTSFHSQFQGPSDLPLKPTNPTNAGNGVGPMELTSWSSSESC